MFDTTVELVKQISVGEDSSLEMKDLRFSGDKIVSPDSRSIAAELAAMANTLGGVVVFGVDDRTRSIVGIPSEKLEAAEAWVRNLCYDLIEPQLDCPIRKVLVPQPDGHEVVILRVDVPKSLFVHRSPLGYHTRIGSSKRELTPDMLARLFQQRSQARMVFFDEQVVPGTAPYDLDKAYWDKFRTVLTSDEDLDFLKKLKLVSVDDEGNDRLTVAGVLLATERPSEYLRNAYIQAVCYGGVTRDADYQLDARDISGPLDMQIKDACDFVRRNMRTGAKKDPARVEAPQYSMRAVFEAITNAVAHRDYSISQSCIRLHMFRDRIELFSPGSIPNTMTIESMPFRQFSRNELIASLLSRCPLEIAKESGREYVMDRRGEGVPIIISETKRVSGKPPVFRLLDQAELMITIPAADIGSNTNAPHHKEVSEITSE